MKLYKLIAHQKNFSEEEIILSPKDFPHIKVQDIVEIYHPDDVESRLLLQVHSLKDETQTKVYSGTISVEQSIVTLFQLQIYCGVCVNVVNPDLVALNSVELTFKDQYLGRSDMWRLKNSLIGSCIYTNKKLEFCHKSVRCQVYEMWAKGERVPCGVITKDTKIVFRSSTGQVYLFLQMSSEMWDFDIYGDLYFEKAVNGFLSELFAKWKRHGSNHEVTIVLFSRVFYEADSLESFPEAMRSCLQQDYRGKFYEDFYRAAVQSERLDDWACVLPQLKQLFHNWQTNVLAYHQDMHSGLNIPKGVNSSAAQGNFLEVLNMSLNVFEKHYLDRSFDRTGQVSVVITPGVGVFEVDRELTNITKQRIIDNGVGSDLVCVGEQPLHAVPLLQFHNKRRGAASNDFSMPHWINLSFYSSSKRIGYSTFLPRIKMAPIINKPPNKKGLLPSKTAGSIKDESTLPNSVFDYDAYDAKVFAVPFSRSNKVQTIMRDTGNRKTTLYPDVKRFDRSRNYIKGRQIDHDMLNTGSPGDGLSSSLISAPSLLSSSLAKSAAVTIPKRFFDDSVVLSHGTAAMSHIRRPSGVDDRFDDRKFNPHRVVVGSAGSPCEDNPNQTPFAFDASTRQVKTGRALINPFDPSQVTIKLTSNRRRWTHIFPKGPSGVLIQQHHFQAVSDEKVASKSLGAEASNTNEITRVSPTKYLPTNPSLTLLWGATGEQVWTPALTTGVDWKSLTIPACLPITTDYFPDQRSLQNDFVVSDYSMIPDDVNADYGQQRAAGRRPLETQEVFRELVSQRLAQGFQLIILPNKHSVNDNEYLLSIGRIFHKIVLKGSTITVTGYRPRHPYPTCNIHYRYRLQAPDHDRYEISWVDFNAEKLENYNWNHLDHYICTRGDRDFALTESLKYWRLRLCVLPTNAQETPYPERVLRFIETCVNRLKRPNLMKRSRPSIFRERISNNLRLPDRPRPRSTLVESRPIHLPTIHDSGLSTGDSQSPGEAIDFSTMRIRSTASSKAIVDAMKSSTRGMDFLGKSNGLPPYTFVSYESVAWVIEQIEGIKTDKEAIDLLQRIMNDRLMCHASGNTGIDFRNGFFLYTLLSEGSTLAPVDNFDAEWAEVEFGLPLSQMSIPAGISSTDGNNISQEKAEQGECDAANPAGCENRFERMLRYKFCNLDMDISNKSDRIEWGHLRYQTVFYPDASLEFIFQWIVCTGPLVYELVQNWLRKAQNCGVNLVPVPCDPFALPMSNKADPLRAPIFVPLNLTSLEFDGKRFLDNVVLDTWPQHLHLFQENIARLFGFLPCSPDPMNPSSLMTSSTTGALRSSLPQQFIHSSGTVFIQILSPNDQDDMMPPPSPQRTHRKSANWLPNSALLSPNESSLTLTSYITHHVVGRKKWQHDQNIRIGFLWAVNSMLSRRWRNSGCVDENTASKLYSDFRKFCANDRDRLKNFWIQSFVS